MEETQSEVENILTPAQLERFRARRHRWPRRPGRFGPAGRQPGPRPDRPDARDRAPGPPESSAPVD
jgi:hypothetical protein